MKNSFQRVIATLNLFQGKQSLTIFLLATIFALTACDDSSSASEGNNETSAVESSSSVKDSDSTEESSSSIDKKSSGNETKDKYSSSENKSSSSTKETKGSSDSKSSSSVKVSILSSSSVALATPCKTETEDNCEYSELVDERDGQTYKTVKIGDQWWMAENLNYAYTDVPYRFYDETYTSDSTSWCYDNEVSNCEKYGRLYTWSAVMDSAAQSSVNAGTKCGHGKTCTPNSPHRGICPEGWHLPTLEEWLTLLIAVGGSHGAGRTLRSNNLPYNRGSDDYGFSVLYAGGYRHCGDCSSKGYYNALERTYFWSSTEGANTSIEAKIMQFDFHNPDVKVFSFEKFIANSVRCVKDSD